MANFTVTTGYGYIKDSEDHIIAKCLLEPGDHPIQDGYTYVEVADQDALDQIEIYDSQTDEDKFSPVLFLTRLAEEFTVLERLELSKVAPNFTEELKYKNFLEIKQIRDYLVSIDDISVTQASLLTSLFTEQNINLEDYGETGTGAGTGV